MITTEIFNDRIELRVLGELTLADFKALEEMSAYRVRFNGPIDLMLDLSGMLQSSVDVALEQLNFVRSHPADFGRVAIVTQSEWVTWASWLAQFFSLADIRVFQDDEGARLWLSESLASEEVPPIVTVHEGSQQLH